MNKQIDSISKTSSEEQSGAAVQESVVESTETNADPVAPVTSESAAEPAESFDSMFPEPTIAIAGPPSWVWWAVLAGASVVLGIVGYSLARQNISGWLATTATPSASATTTPTSTPTPTPTATPTPTTTPTPSLSSDIVKSSITLRVLNGTKITGAAGTAKTLLEDAGFIVRTTGNANNQTYTATYVYYQTGKLAEAQAVAAALAEYSPVLQESTLANPDNVLVVVAKK